jgi:hypothetical protein
MGEEVRKAGLVPRILVLKTRWKKSCVQTRDWSRRNKLGADDREM